MTDTTVTTNNEAPVQETRPFIYLVKDGDYLEIESNVDDLDTMKVMISQFIEEAKKKYKTEKKRRAIVNMSYQSRPKK